MVGFDSLSVTMGIIARAAYDAMDSHMELICYYVPQLFAVLPYFSRTAADQFPRKIFMKDIFIFQFSLGHYLAAPMFVLLPLFRDFDVVQTVWTKLTAIVFSIGCQKETMCVPLSVIIIIKILSSLSYALALTHAASVLLLFIVTLNIMVLEVFIQIAKQVLALSFSRRGSLFVCIRRLNMFRILYTMGNSINNKILLAIFTGVGCLTASLCGFVFISMHSKFPIIMYLSCSSVFFIGIVITMVLITLAAIPNAAIETIRNNWTYRVRTKQDKLLLMSLPEMGFGVGFVRTATYGTAFTIIDSIINSTMSLVLF